MITTNQKSTVNKQKMTRKKYISKESQQVFPDGSVVKNLPANEGDTDLIPDPGRSHMLKSNSALAQLLSLLNQEPQLLSSCTPEPLLCNRRSYHNKPEYCN